MLLCFSRLVTNFYAFQSHLFCALSLSCVHPCHSTLCLQYFPHTLSTVLTNNVAIFYKHGLSLLNFPYLLSLVYTFALPLFASFSCVPIAIGAFCITLLSLLWLLLSCEYLLPLLFQCIMISPVNTYSVLIFLLSLAQCIHLSTGINSVLYQSMRNYCSTIIVCSSIWLPSFQGSAASCLVTNSTYLSRWRSTRLG